MRLTKKRLGLMESKSKYVEEKQITREDVID